MVEDEMQGRYAIIAPQRKMSDRARYKSNNAENQMNKIGMHLWGKAIDVVGQRTSVENMWSLWQKYYDGETFVGSPNYYRKKASDDEDDIKRGAINKIRVNCDTLSALLESLACPENDKSWSLKATPVPQLIGKAKRAGAGMVSDDTRLPEEPQVLGLTEQEMAEGQEAKSIIEIAREAAMAKERIIEDYLEECDWKHEVRRSINQSVQIGTSYLKGPVGPDADFRKAMKGVLARDPNTGQSYRRPYDPTELILNPRVIHVDAWDVYPDMDARRISECEFIFQRHDLSRNDLLRLMRVPGYMSHEIALAISDGWMGDESVNPLREREMRFGMDSRPEKSMFTMWEYTGSLMFDDYCVIAEILEKDMGKQYGQDYADEVADEARLVTESGMAELNVVIRMVNGRVVSMMPTPCNFFPGEIYHAFTPFPTSGIYGVGLPDTSIDLQRKLNALFEDLVRASRLSATCHMVVHSNVIPKDGMNLTKPINLWSVGDDVQAQPGMKAFELHTIPDLTVGRIEMIHEIEREMDSVSGIPMVIRGESAHANETASGLHLQNNNAQNYARRIVRMMDDQMIKPLIDSFNLWEEINGTDESAKGDQKAIARGASVLFSRQLFMEAIPAFYSTFAPDADITASLNKKGLMTEYAKAVGMDIDAVIKTPEQVQREEAAIAEAQKNAEPPPEVRQKDRELDLREEELNIEQERIQSNERIANKKAEFDDRKTAAELAVENPARLS